MSVTYRPDEHTIEVERGPEPGGLGGLSRAFGETLRGLATTFDRLVEGPVTIQYSALKMGTARTTVDQRSRTTKGMPRTAVWRNLAPGCTGPCG